MLGGNHRIEWSTTFPFGHIFRDELGGENIVGHPVTKGDVIIENDVWLGNRVTIMSGVRIGNGAVVAANSTVVKEIGDYEVWGGNPAKRIKERFSREIIYDLQSLRWWDMNIETIRKIAPLLSQPPTKELIYQMRSMASL